jgi:hypothetical protein
MFCTCFPRKSLKREDAELIEAARKDAEKAPSEAVEAPREPKDDFLVPPAAVEVSFNHRLP